MESQLPMQIKSVFPPVLSKAPLILEQVSPLSGGLEAYTELHSSWLWGVGESASVSSNVSGWSGIPFEH